MPDKYKTPSVHLRYFRKLFQKKIINNEQKHTTYRKHFHVRDVEENLTPQSLEVLAVGGEFQTLLDGEGFVVAAQHSELVLVKHRRFLGGAMTVLVHPRPAEHLLEDASGLVGGHATVELEGGLARLDLAGQNTPLHNKLQYKN